MRARRRILRFVGRNPAQVVYAGDGPEVVSVLRYGYHMIPTTVVLTFDEALDAVTAEDFNDYRIIGPSGKVIGIKSAVYDPAKLTVTLHPQQRIYIHYRYELTVDGTAPDGLTNTQRQLLDGADNGKPGSNYSEPLTWRNLVLDPPWPKPSHPAKVTTRNMKLKSVPAHALGHEREPGWRAGRSSSRNAGRADFARVGPTTPKSIDPRLLRSIRPMRAGP